MPHTVKVNEPIEYDPAVVPAVQHGAPDLPPVVSPRDVVIAAAGIWGRYGSVVVLRRDREEDNALRVIALVLGRQHD